MFRVLGRRVLSQLPSREFTKSDISTVTFSTQYYGANSDVIAGFITTPIEAAVAQAQGIDYLSSISQAGSSTVIASLRLNYDANKALTEISTKVNSVLNQLPPQSQQPIITLRSAEHTSELQSLMRISYAVFCLKK